MFVSSVSVCSSARVYSECINACVSACVLVCVLMYAHVIV